MAKWCIDPGHGGLDRGFSGQNGDAEADYNLKAALACKKALEDNGQEVVLTREHDVQVTSAERCSICSNYKCDYFVSIHMNGSDNDSSLRGVNCYIFDKADSVTMNMAQRVVSSVYNFIVQTDETNYEGINESSFAIMKYSGVPTIMIEGDYITNPEVEGHFNCEEYGIAIAYALIDFADGPFDKASYAHPEEIPRYEISNNTYYGKLRDLLNQYGYRDYMDRILKVTDDEPDAKMIYALSRCKLKKGDANDIVLLLKDMLSKVKYHNPDTGADVTQFTFKYKNDPLFDNDMDSVIKFIQRENKLNPDGIITCKLWVIILTLYCK